MPTGSDDLPLDRRDLFRSHLNSEISARDHHRIGESDDGFEVLDGRWLFQLRHYAGTPGDDRTDLFDIFWALNERQRDPVCAKFKPVGQVNSVFGRQSGQREDGADDTDPFTIGQHAAHDNPSHCLTRSACLYFQSDLAVVEQKLHTRREGLENLRMGQTDPLVVSRPPIKVEPKFGASGQDHTTSCERTDA